jgi:hypothetical protein
MSDFNIKKIQDDAEQINTFVRAAKKKSSLKTSKTNSKDLHTAMNKNPLGTVKIKTLKWNNEQLEQLQLDKKPLSSRKKLDESKSYYKQYVLVLLIL